MDKKKQIIILISTLTFLIVSVFSIVIYKKAFKESISLENSIYEQENKDSNKVQDKKIEETDTSLSSQEENINEENQEEKETSSLKEDNKETKKENLSNKENNSNKNISSNHSDSSSNKDKKQEIESNNTTTKPIESDTKEPPKTSNEELDEVNTLRRKIENTYGITIKYGNELGSYKPKRLTPIILNDKDKIKKELNLINNELKKYPQGFFREFSGMPLTIYLVSSVPGNVFSGFTDKEFMSDIKITLTENYFFEYTLNHEIMHYIDAYLEIKMYPDNPYDEYMTLNPQGFNYGQVNKEYNYGNNGNIKGAYFVDDYAQSAVREDRAELFKNMITRLYKPVGMFDNGEVLQKKALIIDKQIRKYFKSANGVVYWDKIIGK